MHVFHRKFKAQLYFHVVPAAKICYKPAGPAAVVDLMARWLAVYPDWKPPPPPVTTTVAPTTTPPHGNGNGDDCDDDEEESKDQRCNRDGNKFLDQWVQLYPRKAHFSLKSRRNCIKKLEKCPPQSKFCHGSDHRSTRNSLPSVLWIRIFPVQINVSKDFARKSLGYIYIPIAVLGSVLVFLQTRR